jgi:D-arabinose 1-dehydrogenase-like Zn-dependent alcohol dehydrogenase
MRAMLLQATGSLEANPEPLVLADVDDPSPGDEEILIRVAACGVCHTELDEIEGRTPPPVLPVIPAATQNLCRYRKRTQPLCLTHSTISRRRP